MKARKIRLTAPTQIISPKAAFNKKMFQVNAEGLLHITNQEKWFKTTNVKFINPLTKIWTSFDNLKSKTLKLYDHQMKGTFPEEMTKSIKKKDIKETILISIQKQMLQEAITTNIEKLNLIGKKIYRYNFTIQ
jgi:hypothetical protein